MENPNLNNNNGLDKEETNISVSALAKLNRTLLFLLVCVGVSLSPEQGMGDEIMSFSKAKRLLLNSVYADYHETFYCGCGFNDDKQVEPNICGYKPRKNAKRGGRIEWEHVVPASDLMRDLPCAKASKAERNGKSRRRYCGKVSSEFRKMEGDMHNLVPAVGELNGDRSNYPLTEIPGNEERLYGSCDFEVVKLKGKKYVEPRPEVRGDIARASLYMEQRYELELFTEKQRAVYKSWMKKDPVNSWECKRNRRIKRLQGNGNPFVEKKCKK